MIKTLSKISITLLLVLAGIIWLIEGWILSKLGRKPHNNCFTYAFNNFDYLAGDGLVFHKSKSGWFPHILLIKNAQHRDEIFLVEYVPVNRVAQRFPPRRFHGEVKMTTFKSEEAKKSPE